ncbi:MAG: hypothetical protein ACOCXA_06860, partial [Planctomycetota bacterium]
GLFSLLRRAAPATPPNSIPLEKRAWSCALFQGNGMSRPQYQSRKCGANASAATAIDSKEKRKYSGAGLLSIYDK